MDETFYSKNDWRLYHHGVLGQKWGQRNGPPYPLDAGEHSASERKAGWRKSLGDSIKKHKEAEQNKFLKKRQNSLNKRYEKSLDEDGKKRLDRFKQDMEKARNAKTDEEHDRLERIADTRNGIKEEKYQHGKTSGSIFTYKDKNAEYLLPDNSDTTIETIHTVQDNYKEYKSLAKKAATNYLNEWKKDGSIKEAGISDENPLVDIYKGGNVVFVVNTTGDLSGGAIDVDIDLKRKRANATGYND